MAVFRQKWSGKIYIRVVKFTNNVVIFTKLSRGGGSALRVRGILSNFVAENEGADVPLCVN